MSIKILGIDPGSLHTGYALIGVDGRKLNYIDSGVLHFDGKIDFLDRLSIIQEKTKSLFDCFSPDEVSLESLIYVKSPTALIKLAQTRGIILSYFLQSHKGKIFEYSPNLVKSTCSGHGHADKESIQKTLGLFFGPLKYESSDESDALAIAVCHALMRDQLKNVSNVIPKIKKGGSSLANSVSHKIKVSSI